MLETADNEQHDKELFSTQLHVFDNMYLHLPNTADLRLKVPLLWKICRNSQLEKYGVSLTLFRKN